MCVEGKEGEEKDFSLEQWQLGESEQGNVTSMFLFARLWT